MRRQLVVLQQEVNEVRQTLYRYQEDQHIEITFPEKDT
jgi:hypothetical protein